MYLDLSTNKVISNHILKRSLVKSETVIEVFDHFPKQLTKATVVVLDNASFHKSAKFKENIAT